VSAGGIELRMTPIPHRPQTRLILLVTVLFLLGLSIHGIAQESSAGRRVYEQNSASVALLLAKDTTGADAALGTGFWVEGKKLITNAHVANSGSLVIQIGPVRIPCHVEKLDQANDLAILTVDADVTVPGLQLAKDLPKPGDVVYTITNPEGLEKTMSQGVVAGFRTLSGRQLLQITAPISHGSSGGPIFNSSGQVVGVAVGMLAEGQNLNFAVPTSVLRSLLAGASPAHSDQCAALLQQIKILQDQEVVYSDDPDSEYQKKENRLNALLETAFEQAGTNADLQLMVSNAALYQEPSIAVKAARRAVEIKPSTESNLALATALDTNAFLSSSSDSSALLSQAHESALAALRLSKRPSPEIYSMLGEIEADQGHYKEAEQSYSKAYTDSAHLPTTADRAAVIRGLIRSAAGLGDLTSATRWFNALATSGAANRYDWSRQGDRLEKASKYVEAAAAYDKAAQLGSDNDLCNASYMHKLAGNDDKVLEDSRGCIQKTSGYKNQEHMLSFNYTLIASVLNKRGVYIEALNNAKEAVVFNPSSDNGYEEMAKAQIGLQRFQEAVHSAEESIRLSDGKYSDMHFLLGSAYFKLENWELARQSYEKAAQLDPTDSASAYNVALCLGHLHYYRDAAQWYEEYLRRDPQAKDRAEVLEKIRILRQP
jgi:tetratricopeptide (TPR) repeat protein